MRETPGDVRDEESREVRIEVGPHHDLRWLWITVAAVVIALAAYFGYQALQNSDEPAPPVSEQGGESDGAERVSDSDEVVTELPQQPSLGLAYVDGVAQVTNDGNVTMASIEVRNPDGSAACTIAQLAPGSSETCAEATEGGGHTVFGVGPQGQEVDVSAG
jgi:hypothetical protein